MIVMLGIALGLLSVVVRGVVLSVLWFWFMVPLSVAPIETAHAIGLSVLVSMLTKTKTTTKTKTDHGVELLVLGFMYPVLALFIGWIAMSAM